MMNHEKKYFISYQWQSQGSATWTPGHDIVDIHPLDWLYWSNGETEAYHLLWWKELTTEEVALIRNDEDLPLT